MTSALPTVSFVLVTADGKDLLAGALDSIAALEYPQDLIEIWVVDNGSSDGTVTWLKQAHAQVRIIENATNEGFARPNNIAAARATGEWLALINNDMRLESDWLRQMLALRDAAPSATCVASRILNWDGKRLDFDGSAIAFTGHGLQPNYGARPEPAYPPRPIPFACGGAMLIRRDVFLEVGGFDERYFAYYEDVDLGWRLWLCGYEVMLAPEAVAYHHHNATSSRAPAYQKRVLMERNALYSALKNYSDENLARVLPPLLLLGMKRMALKSTVDRAEFRFSLPSGGAAPSLPPPAPKKASRGLPLAKAVGVLRRQGPAAVLRKSLLALATLIVRRWGVLPYAEGGVFVDRDAYAHLVAYEDVLANLDAVMADRSRIQAMRKRSDHEVLALFGSPFQTLDGAPEYLDTQMSLMRNWNLPAHFPEARP